MLLQRFGLFFVVLAFLIFLQCESKHHLKKNVRSHININSKVVGGTPVPIQKFPFAVQFMNSGKLCGGVIIHSWAIVTAGHCVASNKDKKEMIIQAGARYLYDSFADTYRVLHFVIHEDYKKETSFSCDIALVFPSRPFKFGNKIMKTILANHNKWMDEQENTFTVIGWGRTKENGTISKVGLQMARLRYVSGKKCSLWHNNYTITSEMFCLYGDGHRDTCKGDSGGGVIWNDMLVGLTSHGNGCARKYKPTIYTNVWVMRDWINITLNGFYSSYCNSKFRTTRTVPQIKFVESLEIFI